MQPNCNTKERKEMAKETFALVDLKNDEALLDNLFSRDNGLPPLLEDLGLSLLYARAEMLGKNNKFVFYMKEQWHSTYRSMVDIVNQVMPVEEYEKIIFDAIESARIDRLEIKQVQTIAYWSILCPVLIARHFVGLGSELISGPQNKSFCSKYISFFNLISSRVSALSASTCMRNFICKSTPSNYR
jgi:hypothetical protein